MRNTHTPIHIDTNSPVAFGKESIITQLPPIPANVSQVRHILALLQVVSTLPQNPSFDSSEHAIYGIHESNGT